MKKNLLPILGMAWLLFGSFMPSGTTVKRFGIFVAGVRVGSMIATRAISEDITVYNLKSDAKVYLLKWYHITDEVNSIFASGKLMTATVKTSTGKKSYLSTTTWSKDHYDLNINSYHYSKNGTETSPIQYSVARLYFEEPAAGTKIFSEAYGVFADADMVEANTAQMLIIGKKNKFSYQNGELEKADMQSSIKDFIIKAE